MKLRNLAVLITILLAFLLCIPVSASATSINLTLVGTGSAIPRDGVYAGQYLIQVDGGSIIPMFCDDYNTEIPYIPYSWSATDTGPGKFDPSLYGAAAYLVQYATTVNNDPVKLADIGQALWRLMTSDTTDPYTPTQYQPSTQYYGAVQDLVQLAEDNPISDWASVMVVYTPVDQINNNSQEFLMAKPVPEPATMLLLGTGLIGLAGFGRKKLFKK